MTAVNGDVIGRDLNETIAHAVQARIESAVAADLSSSDLFGQFVQAALLQPIEVGSYSDKRKTNYLRETIAETVKAATKVAVQKYVDEQMQAELEALIATELRRRTKSIAAGLAEDFAERSKSAYGITVHVNYPKD